MPQNKSSYVNHRKCVILGSNGQNYYHHEKLYVFLSKLFVLNLD